MKRLLFAATILLASTGEISAQEYGSADTRCEELKFPQSVTPLFDHWLRDTWATLGPDGYYYMTGTTASVNREYEGEPHCWDWNDELYLWRSKNLKRWENMGVLWAVKDGSWQSQPRVAPEGKPYPKKSINGDKLDNKQQAVWAPELHYIKSAKNWFLVACMNSSAVGRGSFIMRSTTGCPEGPYENIEGNRERGIFKNIDGSLFEDNDGTVYFVGHNHFIARMKSDMSGFDEEIRTLKEQRYVPEPYAEGAYIVKYDGKYHLLQTFWAHRTENGDTYLVNRGAEGNATRYSYDCVISTSDNVYGPYTNRYTAITGGGHNNFFQDKSGKWWSTTFFNPRGFQASEFEQVCRPGLVPIKYENGKFIPDHSR